MREIAYCLFVRSKYLMECLLRSSSFQITPQNISIHVPNTSSSSSSMWNRTCFSFNVRLVRVLVDDHYHLFDGLPILHLFCGILSLILINLDLDVDCTDHNRSSGTLSA